MRSVGYISIPEMPPHFTIDYFINACCQKQQMISFPKEEVTTHGLDEITSELRKEIKSTIDDETNKKLEEYTKLTERVKNLVEENEKLHKDVEILENALDSSNEDKMKLNEKLQEIDNSNIKLDKITRFLEDNYTSYGKWRGINMVDRIIDILNSDWLVSSEKEENEG